MVYFIRNLQLVAIKTIKLKFQPIQKIDYCNTEDSLDMKRIYQVLILIGFFYGCASKKTITKEVIKRDSIFVLKDRFITKKVNDTIVINEVCDTLGNLKSFDRVIKANNVKVSLKSVKGSIQATVNIDSIVSSRVREFKQNYEAKTEVKETIKYRIPFWVWCVMILETLVILLLFRIRL